MADSLSITALSDAVIEENYDPGAVERGRGYADDGRVRIISVDATRLTSVVAGSGRNTYLVNVAWRPLAGGIVIDDNCSCPLGGFCKHAVASILVARRDATAIADVSRPTVSWRRLLDGIVASDTDRTDEPSPLALQFSVQMPRPSHFSPEPDPRIAIRPMRKGKRGQWIKTGASWREIHYAANSTDLIGEHVAALRALWNASPRHSYYPDTGPITLATFGPELWIHLANLAHQGVDFIDEQGRSGVTLHESAAWVDIDVTTSGSGDVTLATSLVSPDGPLAPADASSRDQQIAGDVPGASVTSGLLGFLGSPPHGVFTRDAAARIDLYPLEKQLDPALLRMLANPPVLVPSADVDELLDVYQPQLAQRAHVGSSDASVTINTRSFAGLTLQIKRHAVDVVSTSWWVRYQRDDQVSRYGLSEAAGALRDRAAEARAVMALDIPDTLRRGLLSPTGRPVETSMRGVDAVGLLTETVPWLTEHSLLEVLITDVGDTALPDLREATADPLVELSVTDAPGPDEGNDWFDLAVNVSVDGEQIPFVALFTALARNDPVLVLTSGTWLRLDRPEFARLKALIEEARGLLDDDPDTDDDSIRVNAFQISWFDELAALGVITEQSDRWAANVARMNALAAPGAMAVPQSVKAELRPYQQDGFAWLSFLEANHLGGILADDMGLGKTLQVLSLCASILEDRPDARFLVVAPTSVVENWKREANRFTPTMAAVTITETTKRRGATLAEAVRDASLVVTSYTLFRLEFDDYATLGWDLLLLDEAQFVKNHHGKTYKAVRQLRAGTKIAITGTPLENSLMDLWSLLSITAPGLYPDPDRFSRVYRKPIERGEAPELLATLRRRIAPLMRRRTKDAVLTELPPKTEQVIDVELGARHRRLYQTRLQRERAKVLGLVDDVQRNRFVIFKSLTLLRQLSLDPGLVDEADDHIGSAKLDRLVEDLAQITAEGHRALVFSQFTRFLRRAEARLDAAGIASVYLDGRTRRRAEVIDSFKSGDVPVFLISLKAGGVGLNLAEADYCFILDPWWNPASENQAVDRAHRIGQEHPVVVYRYVSTGTIEEKVMELKARKAALFADVVDADGAMSGALSADDIRGLFEPG